MDKVCFALVALFVLVFGLISNRLGRTVFTAPMAFVLFGLLINDRFPDFFHGEEQRAIVHTICELTLIVLLFTDASRMSVKRLLRDHALPSRLLFIGLPLAVVIGTVLARWALPGLLFWEAVALAVVLAPTDSTLAPTVVSSPRVPSRIRQALNVEGGLNDGFSLPMLLIALGLAGMEGEGEAGHWAVIAVQQLLLSPVIGIAIAWTGGRLMEKAVARDWMTHSFEDLALLGIGILCFSLAEVVEASGTISVFCGGLVMGNRFRHLCRKLFEFAETEGQLLSLISFMLFGAVMLVAVWPLVDAALVLYAALSLVVVRTASAWLVLIGSGLRPDSKLMLSWFGPRGLSTMLFGFLLIEEAHLPHGDYLFAGVVVTVLLSIFAHGITAVPAVAWYARRHERAAAGEGAMAERMPVPELPTAIRWVSPGREASGGLRAGGGDSTLRDTEP